MNYMFIDLTWFRKLRARYSYKRKENVLVIIYFVDGFIEF